MTLSETPRPSDFQEAVNRFKALKGNPDSNSTGSYRNAMQQLRNVLDGLDTENIQATYYPAWSNEDIEDLLTELGESCN